MRERVSVCVYVSVHLEVCVCVFGEGVGSALGLPDRLSREIHSFLFHPRQVIDFDDSSGSVLRIQPLRTHRDEAIYECTATNSAGEINTSAKLTVLEGERPSPVSAPALRFPCSFYLPFSSLPQTHTASALSSLLSSPPSLSPPSLFFLYSLPLHLSPSLQHKLLLLRLSLNVPQSKYMCLTP